jgi:GT2 family glycosyltransferase
MPTRLFKVDFRKLPINICVLAFSSDHSREHDHYSIISRCLYSIIEHTQPEKYRLHIGCNNLSPRAMALVDEMVTEHKAVRYIGKAGQDKNGKRVYPKYPLMRHMFRSTAGREETAEASDWIAWFDDDSYATESDWLERLEETINNSPRVHQLGQLSGLLPSTSDIEWATAFPWFNPAVGIPQAELPNGRIRPGFNFIRGGFYAISRRAITACSVPDERLFHNRGDWSTSLALLHKGFKLADFTYGIDIDAEPRRGIHENRWTAPDDPALAEKGWIIDI